MSVVIVICFLIIFALLLFSISFGLRFYESQRRRKLVSMLRTVTEGGEEHHVNLLIDENERRTGLNDLSGRFDIRQRLATLLSESGLNWSLSRLGITAGVAFVFGVMVGLRVPVPVPIALRALILGLLVAILPVFYVRKKRNARVDELEEQMPDALDFLARSMRAGHAFTISLEMVGEELHDPLGQEFRSLFNELNLGASVDRAFAGFARRVPLGDVRFFSSAVMLQRQTGGNLSEILNRLSHIIRERFRLKGQVKAVSAHGRLTAIILTLLPLGTLGGLLVTSPGYLDPMFKTSLGREIVLFGILAQVLGNFFIRKIIKIKV